MLTDLPFRLSYATGDDPLHTFYIPALSASVRYDRMAGFFTSTALAVAAEGVARLVANGGRMRLLVGAQLEPQDVEAIREGNDLRETVAARLTLPDPDSLTDHLLRDRLAVLAWMVATGTLEIRVVLPTGPDGLPVPAPGSLEYFHPKVGIFSDAEGNQVAFSGSVNESETAWRYNYEQFMVFCSWAEGRAYVIEAVGRFERLWASEEPGWLSMPVPEAVRQRLLRYMPALPPLRDPLEQPAEPLRERAARLALAPEQQRERLLCQFLRDAPHLVGASGLGAATCVIEPWPHQRTVARQLVESFPARYLLADEVGLGKTIEAGLALRQLWLDGRVRRALILAPRSVLRQWQEELYEKFALDVPIYDGAVFRFVHGEERAPHSHNPWEDEDLILASSQLAKRAERRRLLSEAHPWDLVLVDEAHHARRRDFLDLTRYRPNRMLELLNELQRRTGGLILITATPMQVHPIEVWDLLRLLGLSGEWGADGRSFLRFYEELRRPSDEKDWAFIFRMLNAEVAMRGGQMDPSFVADAKKRLGPVDWERVRGLIQSKDPSRAVRSLPRLAQDVTVGLVSQHTPLRRLIFRNTRSLLREYAQQGLLKAAVPHRKPQLVWITMRPDESALYQRIDEYIGQFYHKYESERVGLGFVMTVYRRRLTSSFYAVQQSLKRRLGFLHGQAAGLGLVEEDLEQGELSLDVDELGLDERALFRDEIAYVEDFLHRLSLLGGLDSKVAQLMGDLDEVFRQRETVIIFTQYTDTMDFLREQLRQRYGGQVACYSGRGGERWDGVTWIPVAKEEIKNAFREGRQIKILLCTDAASEGLNLQTCGVMINYDMPWNPMRVEQRIGRVDRIGQKYDEVWIRNYFYQDTVEARVYQALSRRISWFQDVVGPLQPILAQVERAIQTVAMVPQAERQQMLQAELTRLQDQLDRAEAGLDLDEWAMKAEGLHPVEAPVTLSELASTLTSMPSLRDRFRPHEAIERAFWLRVDHGEVAVTLDAATFDAYPNTLQLLTYGNPLLDSLLEQVAGPEANEMTYSEGRLLRLRAEGPWTRVAYYMRDANGRPRRVERLADLREALEEAPAGDWSQEAIQAARRDLEAVVEAERRSVERAREMLGHAQQEALKARAAQLLLEAAFVELALGQQPALIGESYPTAFNEEAVRGLKRHGYPWTALLRLAQDRVRQLEPTDPFFQEVQREPHDRLKQRWVMLRQQAARLMEEVQAVAEPPDEPVAC